MDSLFLKLLNMSITASWLVLAVILLRLLLKKAPKAIICILWALVGVRLLMPFSLESALSLIPSAETVPQEIVYAREPEIHTGIQFINSAVNPIITASLAPPNTLTSINPIQVWLFVAEQIWIIGIAAMLIYTAVSYIRLRFRVREAAKVGDVWLCDNIDTPFILGVLRPKIYIPSSMPESDIEYVTAHERAHIRRRDYIWKPLGFALLTVYWFNPVLWGAYILLCRDIESACDEKVLKEKGSDIKKAYSDALINCSVPRILISACPLAFGETSVKARVKSVLNYKKPAFWIIVVAVVACIVTAVCFLTNPKEDKENVIFNGTPLTFDKEDIYVFYPKELAYDCPMFSYVMTADAAPDYRLHGDFTFEEMSDDTISTLGTMQEITLAKDFDALFDLTGKEIPAELRKNNRRAWELYVPVIASIRTGDYYILLEQKDGTYYICIGYAYEDNQSPLIRWVHKVKKERQSYISQISEVGGYNLYKYHGSPDPITPSLNLYDNPKTFTFSWSGFSSYFAIGKYELTDETLTCKTDDGMNTYVFDVVGDTFVFDASRSSTIPSYKYSADAPKAECPVPDGAVFEFDTYMERFSMISDSAVFDIDKDGEDETVIMSMGPTSGRFTLTFTVIKENSDHFESVIEGGNWSDFYFHEDENGKVTFCTVDNDTEEKTYHELSFKDGNVVIKGIDKSKTAVETEVTDGSYVVDEQKQSFIESIADYGGYTLLMYEDSEDFIHPEIYLGNNGYFRFIYSGFSSYLPEGEYELINDTLTLNTDDGKNIYVFHIVDDTVVFDASRSSIIPEYRYYADAEEKCSPVPDGAVFRSCSTVKEEALSWIEDYAFYDIDGDNKKETLMVSAGPTSGVATFTFTAAKENGEKYENVFDRTLWSEMGFSEDKNGKVQFYTVNYYTGEKRYYDLGVKDGNVYLTDSGVQFENTKYVLNPTNEGVEEFLNLISRQDGEENGKWYNVTPDAIKEEIGVSIFKNDTLYSSYIQVGNETYSLCRSFGGYGFMSGVPCDFDNDGIKDMLFTYSWGSGRHRTEVGVFNMRTKETTVLETKSEQADMVAMLVFKDVIVAYQNGEYILYDLESDLDDLDFAYPYLSLTPISSVKCDENGPYIDFEIAIADD